MRCSRWRGCGRRFVLKKAPGKYGLIKLTTQKFYTPNGHSIDRHDAESHELDAHSDVDRQSESAPEVAANAAGTANRIAS